MHRLGLAWEFTTGTHRVIEATPVVIDGVMITSGPLGRVWALDAASGRELWSFEPEVDMQVNRAACCDWANRGVAVRDGRVFAAALDGWLYALDAKTGKLVWKVDTIVDRERGYTFTGAPEMAGDLVVIGNAGAEYDTRGYVTAYDIADGSEAWRFWTIPRDPKLGPQESAVARRRAEDLEQGQPLGRGRRRHGVGRDRLRRADRPASSSAPATAGPTTSATARPAAATTCTWRSVVALDAKTGAPTLALPGDAAATAGTSPRRSRWC